MTDAERLSTRARRIGVTGTDTGIGKTVVSCALAALARQRGMRVAAMKPVESGIAERPVSDDGLGSDAERLRRACGDVDALEDVRPYALREPLAPFVAAQRAHMEVSTAVLAAARDRLEANRELLLVEGAGGLLVPITVDLSYLDLFAQWECELLLIAGNRLGVLNHVLLTVLAATQARVPVRAIVLTALSECDASVAEATNYDALRHLLPAHQILRFPWVDRHDDLDALAVAAEAAGLDALLAG